MCFAAMADARLRYLSRHSKRAIVRKKAFEELVRRGLEDNSVKWPKALETNFENPIDEEDARIWDLIQQRRAKNRTKWESDLFTQQTRLVAAERTLAQKETKKALNDQRVAGNKVKQYRRWLEDLNRTEPKDYDTKFFPYWFTPVIAGMNGEHVIMPMRYHLRPAGKPASIDRQLDGLYNARRDSLERVPFWKSLFGKRHGILVVTSFFENVSKHKFEHRELEPGEEEENVVLHFNPQTSEPMLLACLWDHWTWEGQPDLYSCAAITDEPPPEVAAAGHDRCVIPIKPENVDAWLNPEGRSKEELFAILDDRQRPFYEHRLAA